MVLPTLDRPSAAFDAVCDVVDQLPEQGEVLVVDQSDEASAEALGQGLRALADDRVTHLRLPVRGLPNARNVALGRVRHPVLLYLDDDVRLRPGCLAAHLACYRDPGVVGVGGRIRERVVRPNHPVLANRIGSDGRVRTNLDWPDWGELQTLKGAHMSFRTAALRAVGGFDRRYGGTAFLEDADASTRVRHRGGRLVYCPDAVLTHLSAPSGGVRVGSPEATERSRFHNTALFVGTHHPRRTWPRAAATFLAIAARRAAEWGTPGAVSRLMDAFASGLSLSRTPPDFGAHE